MSVLVIGATGHVGSAIARSLAAQGNSVTAMLRGGCNHSKSAQLSGVGVRVIAGDLWDHGTLGGAVSGTETVVSTATAMPVAADDGIRKTDHEGTLALIRAAEAEGVKRFVYVSYSGNIHEECPLHTAKRDCERLLGGSTMETVVLRPSYFMEVWLSPLLGFDPAKGSARIYGSGEAPVSYIASSNVADFAVAAVSAKLAARHTIVELGGPEALSQLDAVRSFELRQGRPMKLDRVPIEALRAQLQSAVDPPQKSFAALMLSYAEGDAVKEAVENAQRFNVTLQSVSDYASRFDAQVAIS